MIRQRGLITAGQRFARCSRRDRKCQPRSPGSPPAELWPASWSGQKAVTPRGAGEVPNDFTGIIDAGSEALVISSGRQLKLCEDTVVVNECAIGAHVREIADDLTLVVDPGCGSH